MKAEGLKTVSLGIDGVYVFNVEGVEAAEASADEKRYDLQGRPVTKSSKRRIYVVKGKKVLNNQK